MAMFKMIKKYFLVILIILISGCQVSNQTKGDGNSSFNTSSNSSTNFTITDNVPRLALVIGNSDYENAEKLANPLNDADDMAVVLGSLGFEVILKKDMKHRAMKNAVKTFTRRLNREKGIGLFYFSGHGLQDNKFQNFLIPVNADIDTSADIEDQAVNANWVLAKMSETNNRLNLLILDACRNSLQEKSYIKKGLATMKGSLGSLVAYATAPDNAALGSEKKRNSVYTKYLVEALKNRSNHSVLDMLTYVTNKVAVATENRQIPWQSGSMKDIFCFNRCGVSNEQAEKIANIKKQQAEKIARRDEKIAERDAEIARLKRESDAKIARLQAKLKATEQQQGIAGSQIKPTPIIPSNRIAGSQIKPTPIIPSNNFVAGKVFQDRLKDGSLGPKMVVIPAGSFRMGDIQGGGDDDEQPVHRVSVGKFAMGVYEVTFAEYDKFAEADGRTKPDDRGWGRGNRPVINVSWNDATAYTEWLSNQTGKKYRLPTEAEWEYAARAGTETKFWWGNDIGKNRANCDGCGSQWDDKQTAPSGSFYANKFGLYDTSGNVWEWTCSEYEDKYKGKEKVCIKKNSNKYRVLRGGSWLSRPRLVRTAVRDRNTPVIRYDDNGFRVVLAAAWT
jgi:formylglycine-generating enzyme required for sulfatase activity